jgi:ankyrin repeat protein
LKCGNEGKTALHLAVHVGNVGVVRELLDAGADKSIKDDGGMTPAQLALELSGKQLDMGDIVRLLTDLNV